MGSWLNMLPVCGALENEDGNRLCIFYIHRKYAVIVSEKALNLAGKQNNAVHRVFIGCLIQ
jgi:hypothetical protein